MSQSRNGQFHDLALGHHTVHGTRKTCLSFRVIRPGEDWKYLRVVSKELCQNPQWSYYINIKGNG